MRSALIGCGAVAQTHLRALSRLRGVEVVAVCDRDARAAAETAARFGIRRSYADADELLERERPDAVHVLTPPASHCRLTVDALRAGAHVLVEKPMALSTAEADEMIDHARRHDRSLCVCHNFLFDPAVVLARQLAEENRLGSLLSVDLYWSAYRDGRPDRYVAAEWMRELPGGALHELAPHVVYLCQAFLGPLDILHGAVRCDPDLPASEEAHILFGTNRGFGATSISLSSRPYTLTLRVYGTEASVVVDAVRSVVTVEGIESPAAWSSGPPGPNPGHGALLTRFYQCLAAGDPPPVGAEEGREVVAVLDRLWGAIDRGGVALGSAR